jgi:hypothetical protein
VVFKILKNFKYLIVCYFYKKIWVDLPLIAYFKVNLLIIYIKNIKNYDFFFFYFFIIHIFFYRHFYFYGLRQLFLIDIYCWVLFFWFFYLNVNYAVNLWIEEFLNLLMSTFFLQLKYPTKNLIFVINIMIEW